MSSALVVDVPFDPTGKRSDFAKVPPFFLIVKKKINVFELARFYIKMPPPVGGRSAW
jgi:hypothetical protein